MGKRPEYRSFPGSNPIIASETQDMDLLEIFRALFGDVGEPTLASYATARELERSCTRAAGPHSFYLTMDVRPRPIPQLKWSHNTDLHFGITRLAYEDYINLIQPDWLPIYNQFGIAAYKLAKERMPELSKKPSSYTVKVPLRQMDGSYYWYTQVARPCEFDKNGHLVAHLNTYHRVAPYDKLEPGQPIVTINERPNREFESRIQQAGSEVLTGLLFKGLRERELEVLSHYRRYDAARKTADGPLSSARLARRLKIGITGINKHNTRILAVARVAFPASRFSSVTDLARFLNLLFGPPRSPRT